jgi:uncharacterized protein
MKYLLWIGLILIVLWILRTAGNRRHREARPPAAREPEKMVSCAHCGVHLPESESIRDAGLHYCCAEHQHAAQAMKR